MGQSIVGHGRTLWRFRPKWQLRELSTSFDRGILLRLHIVNISQTDIEASQASAAHVIGKRLASVYVCICRDKHSKQKRWPQFSSLRLSIVTSVKQLQHSLLLVNNAISFFPLNCWLILSNSCRTFSTLCTLPRQCRIRFFWSNSNKSQLVLSQSSVSLAPYLRISSNANPLGKIVPAQKRINTLILTISFKIFVDWQQLNLLFTLRDPS